MTTRYWLGKKRYPETIKKIKEKRALQVMPKGENSPHWGKKQSKETIEKRVNQLRGSNNPNFKHGLSKIREYKAFIENKRIVRKKGNGGSHTFNEWVALKTKYNFMCLCCKKREPEVKLTQDHIVPLVVGGSDDISNIQPLCGSCNSRKRTKTINF